MRNFLRKLVSACFAVLFGLLSVNFWIIGRSGKNIVSPQEAQTDYDCILVLGCLVNGDAPSDMLRDRLDRAIELYNSGVSERILMSGDHGREFYNEVGVMKQYAVDHGVPPDAVFMDHAGFSTYESMYRAKEAFEVQHPLIVTQTYHLYRAVYIARSLGMDADGTQAMPNIYVHPLYNDLREVLARNKDFFFTVLKPKPKVLGDAIPISQSGALTDDQLFV